MSPVRSPGPVLLPSLKRLPTRWARPRAVVEGLFAHDPVSARSTMTRACNPFTPDGLVSWRRIVPLDVPLSVSSRPCCCSIRLRNPKQRASFRAT